MSDNKMVNIYILGKKYSVPNTLTIMESMEYAGYQLKRGCGCRSGFCGACATIYRVKGNKDMKVVLACQSKVENEMYLTQIPFFPGEKGLYDLNNLEATGETIGKYYPEIYKCIGCNSCTKGCSQSLNVMQYIGYAQRGELEKCAHSSFDCVSCGICATRCPAGITHYNVGLLARRLTGKYISPISEHLESKVQEVIEGKNNESLNKLMTMRTEDLKDLYNNRDMEK
ncbi:4Fe-4S dicluster domain-containing protein [uncultured Cetobacterium sp.]|uniref:4Fe-4S dicluster domain-containing protein n=1 Tax=uncultured Cetobacterium sp. TaxID=527638 RepID=UPI00261F3271|nr:4Fe-4S dicluster domain-containing protein [uncultured Cetobacterium sp.]